MDHSTGFLALVDADRDVLDVITSLETCGLQILRRTDASATLVSPSYSSLSLVVAAGARCAWLSLEPLALPAIAENGGVKRLAGLLTEISETARVHLGRTYSASSIGILEEREYEVPDFIDWYQFFGPALASRWGGDYLARGPFESVNVGATGSCTLLLGESPHRLRSRKAAADYLGIRLRPAVTQNSRGEPVELSWE